MVSLLSYHPFLRGRHDELIVLFCPQADILGEKIFEVKSQERSTLVICMACFLQDHFLSTLMSNGKGGCLTRTDAGP